MVNIKCKSLVFLIIWSMVMISVVISSPLVLKENAPLTADEAGFQGAATRGCNGGGPGGRPRPTSATTNATTAASG